MEKNLVKALAVSLLVFLLGGYICFASEVEWLDIGEGNLNVQSILVDSGNPKVIYTGTSNSVLKTEDGGRTWANILFTKGENKSVNFLLFDPQDNNSLFAATGNGLFYSSNQGKSWKRIFQGKNFWEMNCTSIASLPYGIYLGTQKGLFVSKDKGRSWHKDALTSGGSSILNIAFNPKEVNCMYVACVDGVFRTQDGGKNWERVFVVHTQEKENGGQEINSDQDEGQRVSNIKYIACDPNNSNQLYLATTRGVYSSQDKGNTWHSVSSFGLLSQDVKFLLLSNLSQIYAVTGSGVFTYKNERWYELLLNLCASRINFLSLDSQNNLYAACDKGLFKLKKDYLDNSQEDNIIAMYYKDGPNINEIQEAAIKYAEVEPEKIKNWRQKASKSALLPKVSVGVDRNTADLWHWEGGSTTKSEDDILRRGHDSLDWDVTLSWDLSQLIWNDDQTNIDVRSRLMVELRDDILDQVTKIYFERLRVKMELNNLTIEDRKKRFEKELRLQELTAMLDALTGGFFSQQLKNRI